MTEEAIEVLVLIDEQHNYYLIPRHILEQARARVDQQAAIDAALAGDTAGYYLRPGAAPRHDQPERAGLGSPGAGLPGALFAPVGMISLPAPTGSSGAHALPAWPVGGGVASDALESGPDERRDR